MDSDKKVGFAVTTTIDDPKEVLLGKTLNQTSLLSQESILSRSEQRAGRENENKHF